MTPTRRRFTDLAIAVVLLLVAVVATWTAYSYTRSSGLFPIFAGWLFIALVAIEVSVQLRKLRRPAAAETADTRGSRREALINELSGPAWLVSLLLSIWLAGFLIAIPAYLFVFLALAAKRSWGQSALIAVVVTACVYVVFAWLLEYRLYAGLLFGA